MNEIVDNGYDVVHLHKAEIESMEKQNFETRLERLEAASIELGELVKLRLSPSSYLRLPPLLEPLEMR